jgi:signal transduction histidine kinase
MYEILKAAMPQLDFEHLFDAAPHPYLLLTPTFMVLYANSMYLRLMRLSREALVNRSVFSVFKDAPESWLNTIQDSLRRVIQSRRPDSIHAAHGPIHIYENANGGNWQYRHSPVFGKSGEIAYIIQSIERVSGTADYVGQPNQEALSLREQLSAISSLVDAIIRSMPDAVYIGDQTGIWKCNDLAVQMLGFDSAEDLKADIAILSDSIQSRYVDTNADIPPEDEGFSRALRGETCIRNVIIRNIKTGEDKIVRSAAAPILVGGKIIGAVAINTDITEYQQLFASEKLARREAEKAVQDREAFLSIAAHELKTPLTSLRGFVQLLKRQLTREGKIDVARTTKALNVIEVQSVKLTRLLGQLLDISMLQKGRLLLEPEVADLIGVIKEAIKSIHQSRGGQAVVLSAPESLPIKIDAIRLEQVFVNLLDNAMKFSSKEQSVRIDVNTLDAQTVQIVVSDRGMGIPPEQREHIFERSYQAHGKGHLGGMGLGLYISKQIVELHGGRIAVSFPEDGGTQFIISLPRSE